MLLENDIKRSFFIILMPYISNNNYWLLIFSTFTALLQNFLINLFHISILGACSPDPFVVVFFYLIFSTLKTEKLFFIDSKIIFLIFDVDITEAAIHRCS